MLFVVLIIAQLFFLCAKLRFFHQFLHSKAKFVQQKPLIFDEYQSREDALSAQLIGITYCN